MNIFQNDRVLKTNIRGRCDSLSTKDTIIECAPGEMLCFDSLTNEC
jgi:hypothetical protein